MERGYYNIRHARVRLDVFAIVNPLSGAGAIAGVAASRVALLDARFATTGIDGALHLDRAPRSTPASSRRAAVHGRRARRDRLGRRRHHQRNRQRRSPAPASHSGSSPPDRVTASRTSSNVPTDPELAHRRRASRQAAIAGRRRRAGRAAVLQHRRHRLRRRRRGAVQRADSRQPRSGALRPDRHARDIPLPGARTYRVTLDGERVPCPTRCVIAFANGREYGNNIRAGAARAGRRREARGGRGGGPRRRWRGSGQGGTWRSGRRTRPRVCSLRSIESARIETDGEMLYHVDGEIGRAHGIGHGSDSSQTAPGQSPCLRCESADRAGEERCRRPTGVRAAVCVRSVTARPAAWPVEKRR